MSRYLNLTLRLIVWFLLTADISLANLIIGVCVSLVLPLGYPSSTQLKDWFQAFWKIVLAIPIAYAEAIEMVFRPHLYEEVTLEQVKPNRTPGLIFLDIFLITFTPKTIVLKYREDGWYEVHRVVRRKQK